jgi:geranylgeranyl pyrophosphate synthase
VGGIRCARCRAGRDALLELASQTLTDRGHRAAETAVRELFGTVFGTVSRLIVGQSQDMAFAHRADVTVAECEVMAADKTGALLGCACALGAVTGGGSAEQVERLRGFGTAVGLAFQLVDDLLGIWGEPALSDAKVIRAASWSRPGPPSPAIERRLSRRLNVGGVRSATAPRSRRSR